MNRSRLLLIDGHSMAYRAFFALPADNFSTTTGQTTNAVFGFTSMLINVLRDETPSHVAVAFDLSRRSFRTEQYPQYKDGRTATPDEFKSQIPLIQQVLEAFGIPWLTAENFEADDILATLTAHAETDRYETLICTGDRDAFQLVSDHTTVLYPIKGVSELARMTPTAVETKYGVPPQRYPDLAALVGEKSDNLPGIPGVGPKTAAKWILAHDGLDGIIANADAIKGKAGENLREYLPDVMRNASLNKLRTDVEVESDPVRYEWRGWDAKTTAALFEALEFATLNDRLNNQLADKRIGDAPQAETVDAARSFVSVSTAGVVRDWITENAEDKVAIAAQGDFGRGAGHIRGFGLASGDSSIGFDPAMLPEEDASALARWLEDPDSRKVTHDAKALILACRTHGWTLSGIDSDTALAAYLIRPDQRSYSLNNLTTQYLGRSLDTDAKTDAQPTLAGIDADAESMPQRLADTAGAILDLDGVLDARLEHSGGRQLLHDLELPVMKVLAQMEAVGIQADLDHLRELEASFSASATSAVGDAHDAVGEQFNLRSPKQLQEILFNKLQMPKTKRTKTGYTTDADALSTLFAKTQHPVLEAILRHRDAERLKQTVAGLITAVSDDNRIHTTFHQTVAATGRLSSADPNLQNIPVRTDAGRRIRQGFVVSRPDQVLLTCDYSQIEMRIMAHLSEDAGLIDAFHSGEDLHTTVASRVFSVSATQVDAEQRRRIKAMSYGLAYGLSAYGLSQQLGISAEDAKELMEEYFLRFGGVRTYLQGVVEEARRKGYTETMFGRRRYLPDLVSDNRQRREMGERAALNAPIQGSAADIVKIAMLRVQTALDEAGLRSRMLLQVHDELVLEVDGSEQRQVEELVRTTMANAAELAVPLEVSVGAGKNWDEAAH